MSLYLPSRTNVDRLDFKFKFMDDFANYVNELKILFQNLLLVEIIIFAIKKLIFMIQLEMLKFQVFYHKKENG